MRRILLSVAITATMAATGVAIAGPTYAGTESTAPASVQAPAHTVDGPFFFQYETTFSYCVAQLGWIRATPGVYQAGCADTGNAAYPYVIEYWTYDGAKPFG